MNKSTFLLISILFFGLFLTSCFNKKSAYRDLASVKTDVKEPDGCSKIGVVTGATLKNTSVTEAYKASLNDLKSLAFDQGANFVFIKRMSADSRFMTGVAYRCKN